MTTPLRHADPDLVLGMDLGTQGVRVLVSDAAGRNVAHASETFPLPQVSPSDSASVGVVEQNPDQWWGAATTCLRQVMAASVDLRSRLGAMAVTSTSGTLCLLDAQGQPVHPAIMYSDRRGSGEAEWLNQVGAEMLARHGSRFDSSFALPKLLWLQRYRPEALAAARFFAHAADVLVGRLTGEYGVSDWSHALKSGYDLLEDRWPDFFQQALAGGEGAGAGVPLAHFPRVVPPGTVIGRVRAKAAEETGLPAGLPVVAGMTDGCASQVAVGAMEPGQWLSVLGTTLVIKGVTPNLLHDPQGRIYAHRHPSGMWLPGGASNTGGEVLVRRFPHANLVAMDEQAAALTPTGIICYPLERTGERFPFACPSARGFLLGPADRTERYYAACLEGVGYVERLAYELMTQLGASVEGPIRVAGGGARSMPWLQIRANILNRPLLVPQQVEAAFGAAVVAAGSVLYANLTEATRAMVHVQTHIMPQPDADRYTPLYEQFVAACRERGYLS